MKLVNKFIFFCTFFSASVFGQQLSITGKIVDEANQPITFATILLQESVVEGLENSSGFNNLIGTITDENGFFEFNDLKEWSYLVSISFIGYKTESQIIQLKKNENLSIILKESVESLSEVQLTYKKPTIKKEADRLVFNVENTALIEGTMLQVLRSTPGVLVLDNGIIIKSIWATVYINNRKVHLTSDELVQLLESKSANNIQSIEVITNPSAKYDADTGVVLNIVMSKNLVTGYRGSVSTSYTQGVFPRYNAGTSHYFKNNKISFNINYNYTNSKINRDDDDVVNFLDNSYNIEETWNAITSRNTWSENHNLNLNFDFFIDDKNTLSVTSTMLYMPYSKQRILNSANITNANSIFLSRFTANGFTRNNKYDLGFDLDYVHDFTKGELSFNIHHTTYDFERSQNIFSNFFDQNNIFESASAFNTNAVQGTTIFTSKIDYSTPINDNSKFEVGVKYSNVKTKSDITQFDIDVNTGIETIDILNSNTFDYDEGVFAAYSNYSLNTDKWHLRTGLRAEQTNIQGISGTNNQTNIQDYFELFPNASLQYDFSDNFNLYINYKRNIRRPNYTNLNPFRFFFNESTVVEGNPNLLPVFLDHFVAGTTVFKIFTIEAYYQDYDGDIYELPRQDNNTNIVSYAPVNLDKKIEFGFDFFANFNATKNWSVYFVTSFYNIEEEVDFGIGFVKKDQWSNYSILSNDVSFLKDKSLSLNLTLTWVGKNLQGLSIVENRLDTSLSISKTILKKKGVISLAVSDLFNKQDYNAINRYLNQSNTRFINSDSRYVELRFRYKFGNTKLKTNERKKELEELERLEEDNH